VRGGRLALALGATIGALLLTEGVLRMPAVRTPSPYRQTPQGTLARSEAWGQLVDFELAPAPQAGRPRIVWMGESTIAGFPFNEAPGTGPKMSPPGWLDLILSARGEPAEVVTLAAPGIDSRELADLFPHALALSPAAVVVTLGHNEYLQSGLLLDRPWWRHWQLALAVRRLLGHDAPSTDQLPTPEHDFDHAAILDTFRGRLESMRAQAADAGVPLLLCAPVCNLADHPPLVGDDPRLPEDADHAWERGRGLLAAGDVAAARAAFEAARDRDRWPHRATRPLIHAIVETAERGASGGGTSGGGADDGGDAGGETRAGTVLVDVAAAFDAASASGVPGFDLFMDHCHPDPGGQRLMASTVADALEDAGVVTVTGHRGLAPEVSEGLAHFGLDDKALAGMRAVMGRSYVGFAVVTGRWGAYAEFALQNLQQAVAGMDAPGEVETSFALLELLRGDVEAAREHIDRAAETAPEMLLKLQKAVDRYPWMRAAFERNGVQLVKGQIVPLGARSGG
jgi:hypothetical protein